MHEPLLRFTVGQRTSVDLRDCAGLAAKLPAIGVPTRPEYELPRWSIDERVGRVECEWRRPFAVGDGDLGAGIDAAFARRLPLTATALVAVDADVARR